MNKGELVLIVKWLETKIITGWKQGDNSRHDKTSDVRSQLRFLGEVESLKKKRQDEEERERLLRLAKVSEACDESAVRSKRSLTSSSLCWQSRSHSEDPQHQQLKQRAKEVWRVFEDNLSPWFSTGGVSPPTLILSDEVTTQTYSKTLIPPYDTANPVSGFLPSLVF